MNPVERRLFTFRNQDVKNVEDQFDTRSRSIVMNVGRLDFTMNRGNPSGFIGIRSAIQSISSNTITEEYMVSFMQKNCTDYIGKTWNGGKLMSLFQFRCIADVTDYADLINLKLLQNIWER